MSKKHAKYSASGSHRWLSCPGSIGLSEALPTPPDSPYAQEGTLAHECLEELLNSKMPKMLATRMILDGKYSKTMIRHCFDCVEWVYNTLPKDCAIYVEQKVEVPGVGFGTADIIAIHRDHLFVVDFKYGAGIPVEVEENPQLIYYAIGGYLRFKKISQPFRNVTLYVYQPRARHKDGIARKATMKASELTKWLVKFQDGVRECEDPLAGYSSGEHCRFCPAKTVCPELEDARLNSAQNDFEVIG